MRADPSIFAPEVFKRTYPCIQRPHRCVRVLWSLALCGDRYATREKVSALADVWVKRAEVYLRILAKLGIAERRRTARGSYAYRLKPEILASLRRCPKCGSPARPEGHRKPGQPERWICLSCGCIFKPPKPKNGRRED